MSVITNLMVSGYLYPDEIQIVQKALDNVHPDVFPWLLVDGTKVGGSKVLGPEIFIAAINHLDKQKLVDQIQNLKNIINKNNFETLQIFVNGEDDYIWRIFLAPEFSIQCL